MQYGGFDTRPPLVIFVLSTDEFAVTFGDWSGGPFASTSSGEFAVGTSLLNAFNSF